MNEIPRKIILSGKPGKIFGKQHRFVAKNTTMAMSALCHMIPGYRKYMMESHKRGITYAVFVGKKNISQDELALDHSDGDIRIVPVVMGSKRAGLLQTIIGVILVASAFITGGASISTWGPGATAMGMTGASMTLGGVIQMLTPQTLGLSDTSSADNKPSYAFGGVTNTTAQGYPVPVLYGKRRIGGAIISAGIYVEDQQ